MYSVRDEKHTVLNTMTESINEIERIKQKMTAPYNKHVYVSL